MQKRPVFIGGLNVIVEADETVLSRRGIIRESTSADDSTPGTVWIVGLIDHSPEKNFYLKRVANRKITTSSRLFEVAIYVGSKLFGGISFILMSSKKPGYFSPRPRSQPQQWIFIGGRYACK
ncbi:hypothetical protein HZS_1137 [Henneguya salminicola]|nr:hypothetical protein HZS_1137 [Henneguya salminicola]